jgi:putative transposase
MAEWPHAPIHQLDERGAYIVTAGTYLKHNLFAGAERLTLLHGTLLELAPRYGWRLQAWAVFSNHYHFVAISPADPHTLRDLIGHLHSDTARRIDPLDEAPGRRVWFNY